MRIEEEKIIEIKEDFKVPETDIILEAGDRIKVLSEAEELPAWLVKQYEERAEAERKAGSTIEINHRLPTVAIDLGNGDEYFFQGQEAEELLDEVPDNINEEDYLLAISQGW